MRKLFITTLALSAALMSNAQLVEVTSIDRVALPEGVAGEIATVSPDGTYAVIGQMGASTLYKVDLTSGAATLLTSNGMPIDVAISPDSRNIVFRTHKFENRLRYTGLSYVSADGTQAEQELVKPSRTLNGGLAVSVAGITAVEGGKARTKSFAGAKAKSMPVASINYGHLDVTVGGRTTTIDPQGRGSYLWPSVSPDGTKVVYTLSGQGTYVCNLDGSDVKALGRLSAPRWMGNDIVIGMNDRDNGQQYTASTVVAVSLDGTRQTISDPDHIALFPSASADARKVVYATADGSLFVVNLK